ncbi:MAG: DUF4176 domain-containing protein [Defluviitaleaceae bacterium]|nr:DUF4176 domain-containing protein [Defluviitaleaceae bacterium]
MKKFYPLGTIVTLIDGTKPLMIFGRLQIHVDSEKMYDYVACYYPEGKISNDHNVLFNDEDIGNVLYVGYQTTEDDEYQILLHEEGLHEKNNKNQKMKLDYSDITEELCQHCAECCNLYLPVTLDDRFYEYLKARGLNITRDPKDPSNGALNLGYCMHNIREGEKIRCGIYENRPRLCREYNCVAWARYADVEKKSPTLQHAIKVYNKLNS